MKTIKKHDPFIAGAISPDFIARSITHHNSKTNIGAHEIFLGQVRADVLEDRTVRAIEYSGYDEMAGERFYTIREEAFAKFKITCMHVYHSLGVVKAGELCLFVFVSASHRLAASEACQWIVEEIKNSVPVWGKEIFEDDTYQWKENIKA
jgi:molybdopterin synthase catalytic subunit